MPNELQLSAPGDSAAHYAIVRRNTDSHVWDAADSAWATWSDADIADYAIAMNAQGGDLYTAAFPTSIATGTDVRIHFYRQANGSPAIDDLLLAAVNRTWTGDSLEVDDEASVDAYALTTLASVKRQVGITDTANDVLLAELINAASAAIERYCGRAFLTRSYRQWLRGGGHVGPRHGQAILDHYPVAWVDRFATGAAGALTLRHTGSAIRATVALASDSLRLVTIATGGSATTSTLAFESNGSTAALVTGINALDGWSATLITDVPTHDLHRTTGIDARAQAATLTWPDHDNTPYRIDFATGLIAWSNSCASAALVQYHAGYATVPPDVRQVCNEMVAAGYRAAARDSTLKTEWLGDYRYTVAAPGEIAASHWARLDRYREVR